MMVLAGDYYWIGGSGYWSDINHWATSSGGSVLHSQVPTANDDVFFDAGSFLNDGDSVVVNLKNAVCRDMDWSGAGHNPKLTGVDTTSIRLFGSLKLIASMQQNYGGILYFESTIPGKTITTAGHPFLNDVIFNGEGGSWKLSDGFTGSSKVVLNKGSLQTNGKDFVCNQFESTTQYERSLLLSASKINVNRWSLDGTNLTMDAMNAFFTVVSLMQNDNGNPLHYPDIHFVGATAMVSNTNVWVTYHDLTFEGSGVLSGNCTIHDVLIKLSGSISGNDTIHNITINADGNISGGSIINDVVINLEGEISDSNRINTLVVGNVCKITGTNIINVAHGSKDAFVTGENRIGYLSVLKKSFFDGVNDVEKADLYGDGYFTGNNAFGTLNFYPGKSYVFNGHSTQTIRDVFSIDGTCNAPVRIYSDTNSVQATINKVNGSVTGQYLSLKDLKATGITPFKAFHSVDLGNNSGWDIETSNGLDLYWVNGQGNWSDNSHWDTQSGGAGGHCPPTEIDNAIFDAASFGGGGQNVVVDIENAVCKNMTWKEGVNNPYLAGADSNNLHIYGSLKEVPALSWALNGDVYFEATEPGQTIFTAENSFKNNVWFTGRGGSWQLLDKFTTVAVVYFQQGIVYTSGNDVYCNEFSSTDTTTRKLFLSTTKWTLSGVGKIVWNLNAQNLILHADSSLLISEGTGGYIYSFGPEPPLRYNNVIFYGSGSQLLNGVYCYYNVINHYGVDGLIKGNCTIDSVLFHNELGLILDNDTIRAAIFEKKNGEIRGGNHNVQIAIFYDDGIIRGNNVVDTALFYQNGTIFGSNTIDTTIIYNRAIINGNNSIRTATLLGDGQFIGENTFHDLTITKSNSYYLENGMTQTVIDNFAAHGTCTGPIFMQSDENEQQAIIKKINGPVEADYVQLRDIKAEGAGTPFTAYNSVDLGNNTNWNIYVSSPKELYWVNGEGVWSDSLHWSETSGGQGGYCIPTPIDNVYFDQNSFLDVNNTVSVDIGNATCHNMDWTGARFEPVFYSPDTNFLRIYGGLKLNELMQMDLQGNVYFESTHNDNHILMRSQAFVSNVYFQGIGGEWLLDDAFASGKSVYFLTGNLISNGNNISVSVFNTNFTNSRTLNLDNSVITLTGEATEVWYLNGLGINFSAVKTTFRFTNSNPVFRTDNGGPFHYPYLNFSHAGWVFNKNTTDSFDSVYFNKGGQIHGDCKINVVRASGPTSIFDSDSIESVYVVNGDFLLQGGSHRIATIVAGQSATLSGNNVIGSVRISGRGVLSGNNQINEMLDVGNVTTIGGSNFANYAKLRNNGTISGENEFNTLKFYPGNIYELEQGKTQTIHQDFFIRGNNCFPITLRSLHDGQQAMINMPAGRIVSGDFIEIKDIDAGGGAQYFAGHYSTDLTNNSGWIFENAPGYIFGFHNDTVACLGGETVIGTDNFNPDENSTFLWQDGSTNPDFILNGEDKVWVTVSYADNCSFTDTMNIHYKDSPEVELGTDQTLCSGDTVFIAYHSDSVSYVWGDGSTDSVIKVKETGYYTIIVINDGGCKASDSVFVNAIPSPEVDLGPDTTIFSNQDFILDAGNSGNNYFWSTGDTTQSITVNGEGDYWVAVSNNQCMGYDTITISVYPDCILAVPNAFSPNGDGHNDILYARGEGFIEMELMIFNRVGELVFDTKDNSVGWDGTYKGKKQPVDAYAYMLKGVCVSGNSVFKKGNITLLR